MASSPGDQPPLARRAVVRKVEDFRPAATAAGIDPEALGAALAASTVPEKLTFINHAIQHQATYG